MLNTIRAKVITQATYYLQKSQHATTKQIYIFEITFFCFVFEQGCLYRLYFELMLVAVSQS
jgi:hypothetical protein